MPKDSEIHNKTEQPKLQEIAPEAAAIYHVCDLLRQAQVKSCDLLANGSNYVFLATLVKDSAVFKAIYKPRQGEIPLGDFPDGTLYKREYAAFIFSQAIEWFLVPPTVIRKGPHGIGSMQLLVETARESGEHSQLKDAFKLKQVALFDYLVNNADRKAGHFLEDKTGRLWLVDHGLTFNAVPKLRTVLWDFAGEQIPDNLLKTVVVLKQKLAQGNHLRSTLLRLLDESEVAALELRIEALLEKPVFSYPTSYRSVPWPWY